MKCLVSRRMVEVSIYEEPELRKSGQHTVSDITAKVLSDYHMPSWTVFSVKLLLDLGGNVFLDVVLLQCCRRDIDAVLLHLLAHIDVFDNCFW